MKSSTTNDIYGLETPEASRRNQPRVKPVVGRSRTLIAPWRGAARPLQGGREWAAAIRNPGRGARGCFLPDASGVLEPEALLYDVVRFVQLDHASESRASVPYEPRVGKSDPRPLLLRLEHF